jgi:Heterokaryon incompatibility protein (HET)
MKISDTATPWSTLGAAVEISSHSGSERCFEQVEKWINTCQTNPDHQHCQTADKGLALPARLLNISPNGDSLKICTKFPKNVKYIALSHCWGNSQTLTTTKANLKSHMNGISDDALPPLFQDTISICQKLSTEYVWIDSMCIIQDDHRDWARESGKMASIYRGAYLVVAATMAKDSMDHLLLPRTKPLEIDYENSKGEEFTLKARLIEDHHPTRNTPADINGPLMDRAWVLQERVLAKRILHFTATEFLFECMSGFFACECKSTLQRLPTAPALLTFDDNKGQDGNEVWKKLVERYTKCLLTRSTDKLPAISGLAQSLADMDPIIVKAGKKKQASQYLAGLWKPYVLSQLLWSTTPWLAHPHKSSIVDHRAPSFSWTSVDSEIYFAHSPPQSSSSSSRKRKRDEQDAFLAEFVGGKCIQAVEEGDDEEDEATLNKFGETTSGYVKIRGPLLKGTLIAPEKHAYEFYYKFRGSGIVADVEPDCLLVAEGPERVIARRARIGEGSDYKGFKAEAICLAIAWHESFDMISGLVLSPRQNGKYERIGHFTSATWPSSAQIIDTVVIS